ncbi:MAG: MFS transporter, partial [Actinobacteria bacterium]|nr:MFS transporter [Actinomycetota bacterium]
ERGKYMGYLGGVFGIASIGGPLLGGWITDNFSWRWLFFVNLPIGVAALAFIIAYLHLPHTPRKHSLDYVGFVTLGLGLSSVLLATSWGGTQYPWDSWQIISLYVAGALVLAVFAINENYTKEPVIPLRLFGNSIFTLSNVANLAIAMCMFGAIFFIPIYAQGVIGVSVTNSGAVLIPLTVSMILVSVLVGRLITRTGRYKGFVLAGILVMSLGYYLLTRLEYGSTQAELTIDMIVVGLGLGAVLQTYTLIVQNATSRSDLGVATATTQLSRSIGATLGTAIFGTIMTSGMRTEVPKYLPAEALNGPQAEQFTGGSGVGSLLDPSALAQLPEAVATGIREGLAAAMHPVFVAGIPILAVAFVTSLFIKALPLRSVAFVDADKEMLRNANQGASEGVYEGALGADKNSRNSLPTGGALEYLARERESVNGEYPNPIERFLRNLNLDEPDTYLNDIDGMDLEELEEQIPQAQEALDAIDSRLEELMGLRDATIVYAASMAARLATLKQAGLLNSPTVNGRPASRGHEVASYRSAHDD